MKIVWPICGMVLAASSSLPAQQGRLSGPIAGFVFDNSGHVMRPIQGVPGASLLGDPLNFGIDIAAAYIAPHQDSAIVVGADQSLHLFLLSGGAPTEVSLGGIAGAPERVVFSPSGTAVALISAGSARVLTGLPNAPILAGSVKVEGAIATMSGAHSHHVSYPSLALSDDGVYVLTIAQGSARLLSVQGQNRILAPAQSSAQVAFAPGGHDAAVVDSLTGLTLIRDASGAAGTQLLAAPDEGLAGPVGVAFSQDKQTVYVACATAQSVAAFNLAGASRIAIGCACTPATLAPMGNLFRLTELTSGPLWVLDGAAATPRTVFVPARVE
jgi:DNA-binding beta-propeller fold protein YncE